MPTHLQVKPAGVPTWIDLITTDVKEAYRFYSAIFQWEYDIAGPEFGNYATARLGERQVAGLMENQPDAPPSPTAWGLYFATHNIEADVARAVELGATVISPAMQVGDFGSMAICADPTGAAFGFWQAGNHIGWQITDEPGSPSWHELYSPNAKVARDFYTALLGAQAEPMDGGMEYYTLTQDGKMLCGIMQIDPSWGDLPAQWVCYFAVENADDAAARIAANGGKLMSAVEDSPYGRLAAATDPAGANFKIIQLPQR